MLQRKFIGAAQRRIRAIRRALLKLILEEDVFGIKRRQRVGNQRWQALHQEEQLLAFRAWVDAQVTQHVGASADEWLEQYIEQAYRKGQGRAFDDARKGMRSQQSMAYYQGTRDQFLNDAFNRPASVERVKVLATRAFTDLKDVTATMATQMQRTLVDSFIQGDAPTVMARKLANDVDKIGMTRAKMIARTETIRAHAEGQLDALTNMGVTKVGVQVEFSTAGDTLVCPICADLNTAVYDVKKAHGVIPVHPNCRCAWMPYLDDIV